MLADIDLALRLSLTDAGLSLTLAGVGWLMTNVDERGLMLLRRFLFALRVPPELVLCFVRMGLGATAAPGGIACLPGGGGVKGKGRRRHGPGGPRRNGQVYGVSSGGGERG